MYLSKNNCVRINNIMLEILLLVVGAYSATQINISTNKTDEILINKFYPKSTCYRAHNKEIKAQSNILHKLLIKNPLICPVSGDEYYRMEAKQALLPKPIYKDNLRDQLDTKYKHHLDSRYKRTTNWEGPADLPSGTFINYCNNSNCCTTKGAILSKTKFLNLCRECIHLVKLPSSYSPRDHIHVTCQNEGGNKTCFMGEGGCATNMVRKTVKYQGKDVSFTFGLFCSCEIRTDSVFAKYV